MNARKGGFTIIEVTLAIAVTGVLAMALLGGWLVNVNTQSYKDSVNTLVSQVQQQYDEVYNISNDRNNAVSCSSGTAATTTNPLRNVGSSNCIILGRYLLLANNKMTVRRIVGVEPATLTTQTDDKVAIQSYSPRLITDSDVEQAITYNLAWGTTLYAPNDTAKSPLYRAVAILRSPTSGAVYTYWLPTTATTTATIAALLNGNTTTMAACLQPGATVAMTPLALTIAAKAANHEAVGTQAFEAEAAGGGNQCAR